MITDEQRKKILDQHAVALAEHFEHVQIVVTWQDESTRDTHTTWSGVGNWWARVGACQAFVRKDQQSDSALLIASAIAENGQEI